MGPNGSTLNKSNATMYYTTTICNVKTSCIGTIVCLSFICFRCLIVVDYFRFVFFILFLFCRPIFRWREHSAVCVLDERKLKQMEHILTDLTDYRTCTTTFNAMKTPHKKVQRFFFYVFLFAANQMQRERVKWIEF